MGARPHHQEPTPVRRDVVRVAVDERRRYVPLRDVQIAARHADPRTTTYTTGDDKTTTVTPPTPSSPSSPAADHCAPAHHPISAPGNRAQPRPSSPEVRRYRTSRHAVPYATCRTDAGRRDARKDIDRKDAHGAERRTRRSADRRSANSSEMARVAALAQRPLRSPYCRAIAKRSTASRFCSLQRCARRLRGCPTQATSNSTSRSIDAVASA